MTSEGVPFWESAMGGVSALRRRGARFGPAAGTPRVRADTRRPLKFGPEAALQKPQITLSTLTRRRRKMTADLRGEHQNSGSGRS